MSATITWSPVNEQTLLVGSPSTVIKQLEGVFGKLPIEIGMNDMDKLLVMVKMWSGQDNPYEELSNVIVEYGTIRIKAEY